MGGRGRKGGRGGGQERYFNICMCVSVFLEWRKRKAEEEKERRRERERVLTRGWLQKGARGNVGERGRKGGARRRGREERKKQKALCKRLKINQPQGKEELEDKPTKERKTIHPEKGGK